MNTAELNKGVFCPEGMQYCVVFAKTGKLCKRGCKKLIDGQVYLCGGCIDRDYPFKEVDIEEATKKGFSDFLINSGLCR